jgi:TetR/AcrR family transcriptional regulator, transcriptional repressor for nem operon
MNTQQKLIDSARYLIQTRGYNGFSYADVAEEVQLRKASIHHYFPAKSDLARAVVEQSREGIEEQVRLLTSKDFHPHEQLLFYTGYWERCILDATAPFCVAGMLAAEMPTLPADLAQAVREHFEALSKWLETVLTKGSQLGVLQLRYSVRREAEAFMSSVYGAMLIARAYANARMFPEIVELALRQLVSAPQSQDDDTTRNKREAKGKRVDKK